MAIRVTIPSTPDEIEAKHKEVVSNIVNNMSGVINKRLVDHFAKLKKGDFVLFGLNDLARSAFNNTDGITKGVAMKIQASFRRKGWSVTQPHKRKDRNCNEFYLEFRIAKKK